MKTGIELIAEERQRQIWPWEETWWKPASNNRIKDLVRAGALIAAEIDRLNSLNHSE